MPLVCGQAEPFQCLLMVLYNPLTTAVHPAKVEAVLFKDILVQ